MSKTLQEVLNTTLSPDKVKEMTNQDLIDYLIKNKVVEGEADIRMLIVEGIQRAFNLDDEFPIKYYTNVSEEIPDEHKYIDAGPQLTDEFIENNLND